MLVTDSQSLPYPTGNDPGAGALDLQYLAEAIDAKLVTSFADYRSVINRKTTVWRAVADLGSFADSVVTTFGPSTTDLVYSSTSGLNIPNWTASVFSDGTPGYYRVGASILTQTTGAVTANSTRQISLVVSLSNTATFHVTSTETVQVETYDNGLGLQYQFIEILTAVSDTTHSRVSTTLFHTNTASTVAVKAGSVFWVYRVCDLD